MAKTKKPLPPPSSSSSSSEEEASSSEDEQQPTATTKPVVPQTQTRQEAESESESDDESSEDEDEEVPEPESATRPVNNASDKPQPSTPKPAADGESESESGDSEPPKLITPINSRPMAAGSPKDPDAKKSNGKPLFQRIWTLEDEIAVLKGMAEFQSERGPIKPTVAGIEDFRAFIQNKLSLEVVSKSQLLEKIKRLKSKYLAAAARAKSGQPQKFQKPHDESVYELGKKIWVIDDENEGSAKSDGGASSSKRNFPFLKAAAESMGSKFAEEKLAKIDAGKAEVLEKRFKKQKLAEMKHHLRKMDLLKETFKLIMEGIERATG